MGSNAGECRIVRQGPSGPDTPSEKAPVWAILFEKWVKIEKWNVETGLLGLSLKPSFVMVDLDERAICIIFLRA